MAIKSVSKSVVAALLGTALDRGEIASIDARLGDVAPRLIPARADPRVANNYVRSGDDAGRA